MRETFYELPDLPGPAADIDVMDDGRFTVVTHHQMLVLPSGQVVSVPERQQYPIVRTLPTGGVLLVDRWHPNAQTGLAEDMRPCAWIFSWSPGDEYAVERGSHAGPLRGLPGGRFLHVQPYGYSVIEMD